MTPLITRRNVKPESKIGGFTLNKSLLAVAIAFAALAAGDAAPAHGASFTVDATHDAVDAAPGDGACADSAGACTLRATVMETNALSGADAITLPAGAYTLSIAGAGEDASAAGDLDIRDDLKITGAGANSTIIDGSDLDRVIHIIVGTMSLSGVTTQNGNADTSAGGGIFITAGATAALIDSVVVANTASSGGGIYNAGDVTITGSIVTLNTGAPGPGGGVHNATRTVRITDSAIDSNSAATDGGGIFNGLATDSDLPVLTLEHSTISGNTARRGGGIYDGGRFDISGSTLSRNTAVEGGGMMSSGVQDPPSTLVNSTVSGNTGGAINAFAFVTNSTISGNTGPGLRGSAILTNVTIAYNSDPAGGGIQTGGSLVTIHSSIVANNAGGDCEGAGAIATGGNNLVSDGTCGFTQPTDLNNVDTLLGPLADNGGPTQTHALLGGSPAIDAGGTYCPPTDQRGVSRPRGTACDIGAFESDFTWQQVSPSPTPALPKTGGYLNSTESPSGDWLALAPAVILAIFGLPISAILWKTRLSKRRARSRS